MIHHFFEKRELKLLLPFYLSEFLTGFSAVASAYQFLFLSRDLGFSFVTISFCMAAFFAATMVFEIPTGAFADIFGRKRSVLLGIALMSVSSMAIAFVHSAGAIGFLFFLIGTGIAFTSGAAEAWPVDNLRHHRKANLIQTFSGKAIGFRNFGAIFGPLISAVLVNFLELRWLFLIDGVAFLAALIPLALADEHRHSSRHIPLCKLFAKTLKISMRAARIIGMSRNLFLLLIASILGTLSYAGEPGWQPLFAKTLLPLAGLVVVSSMSSVIRAVISPFSTLITKSISHKRALALVAFLHICITSLLFLTGPGRWMWAVFAYLGIAFLVLQHPISFALRQRFIPSDVRATVISFFSLGDSVIGIIGFIFGGYLLDAIGPKMAIIAFAFFALPEMLVYLRVQEK